MLGVGKRAAVEVVDESTGALVAALAGAVDVADGLFVVGIQRIDRFDEVLGRPGVGLGVNVLVGTGSDERVIVDGHAVRGHDEGVLVAGAVSIEAGRNAGRVDFRLVGGVPHVGEIDHIALRAPVSNETFRPFHDEIGSGAAFERGVDLVVAVGVVKVFYGDGDAGVRRLERGDQGIDGVSIAPAADRVGPERDVDGFGSGFCCGSGISLSRCGVGSGSSGLAAGAQGKYHAQCEQRCEQFLHDVPP